MIIQRRAFLTGLASLFGVASAADLRSLVQDRGKPLLLPVRDAVQRIHVYEGGLLTLGEWKYDYDMPRPTWRQQLEAEGVDVNDPVALAQEIDSRSMDPNDLDEPLCDVSWPMAYDLTWTPPARAYRLLARLNIGASVMGRGKIGRLEFHEGDNHPSSNDLWVDALDNLSVSCLQARLIELKQPMEIVMEVDRVEPRIDWE